MYSYIRSNPFQSTLPRGSDVISCLLQFLLLYFNPRSLAGATLAKAVHCFKSCISIHAPSRERRVAGPIRKSRADFNPRSLAGATCLFCKRPRCLKISIHAPSRERPSVTIITLPSLLFQSTLPRGSDLCAVLYKRSCLDFNPRSLAGATVVSATDLARGVNFNPRSLAGATLYILYQTGLLRSFQSTLPRGSDSSLYVKVIKQLYFNPRSLAGATTVIPA